MKIGILGAGALGGYYGGRLAEAGEEVGFVARNETLETLRTTGLTLIDDKDQTTVLKNFEVAENFHNLAEQMGGLDVIINATKSLPGEDALPDLSDLGGVAGSAGVASENGEKIPVVTLHNSVEIPHLAADVYGPENVLPGVVRGYFVHLGPAKVQYLPGLRVLNLGTFDRSQDSHAYRVATQLRDALIRADFESEVWDDIAVEIWTKAMFVTPVGALGALAHQPTGFLREDHLRSSLRGLMQEFYDAALANGVELPVDTVDKTMAFVDTQPADSTSSMQRDIRDGLPNELDAQVGAVRRMAARVGVATPLNDMVHGALEGQITARG